MVGGDFLRHDGDQAFNAIKKLIASSSLTNSKIDFTIKDIAIRLVILEKDLSRMRKDLTETPKTVLDKILPNWCPSFKIEINGMRFEALCDTVT